MRKDSLGDRMKINYENPAKTRLVSRMPVIIRVDGKAFHTFTKGFNKPFDMIMMEAMQETMKAMCRNIQGCVLGYTQSDEISLVLIDYKKPNSSAWFDNEVQKMCSVSASMATLAFNTAFEGILMKEISFYAGRADKINAFDRHLEAISRGAMFDARVFNVPREEVCNYFIWRQQDAIRNSIQAFGQAEFSHKELMGKNCEDIKKMVLQKTGKDWEQLAFMEKYGSCAKRELVSRVQKINGKDEIVSRNEWLLDLEIPVFTEEREYIEDLLYADQM